LNLAVNKENFLRGRRIDHLQGVSNSVARIVNGFGVFFLAVMMCVTTVDVLSRFLFNLPVIGSIEGTEFLMVLTVFLAIPYAAAKNQHITIDALVTKLPERERLILESITLFLGVVLFSVVVWESIQYCMLMMKMNRVTAVLRVPIAPFALVVTFGSLLFSVVLALDLVQKLKERIRNRRQAFVNALIGLIIGLLLYWGPAWARLLPWRLEPLTVGVIGMAVLFLAFVSGLPIFISLILVGFMGMNYLRGPMAGLSIMGSSPYNTVAQYNFSVIPLFVLMGEFCFFSGLGKDLYNMAYRWVGQLPGGLAMGTVVACGGFAAVCGDSMATAVTMGTVTLPEMRRFKYDPRLAVGCVAAGGTLGVLIPPSLAFILYALLADQSIALLFISGILPGILLIALFMVTTYLIAWRDPKAGPPGPETNMREKIASLKGVWATLLLFALVIGGMYAGVFTPTEGGGIGAFGALLIGVVRRRLTFKDILSSLLDAGKISAVCISVLIGANIFGYFLAASMLPMELANYVSQLTIPPLVVLIIILIIYMFLGCLMPAIPMLVLTVPIFYPVITALGYDPIWYGVLMVLMFEMAVITPPMGINVLALKTVAGDIPIETMFRGIIPYLFAMMACVGILIVFPDIALVLPRLFGK
jgi:tripartite ATP-independent transporter DctM subunit